MTSVSSGYSINPLAVHAAGCEISELAGDASAAGSDFRSALLGSPAPAHHHPLVAALHEYADDWARPTKALVTRVQALAEDVKALGVIAQSTDAAAAQDLTQALCRSDEALRQVQRHSSVD